MVYQFASDLQRRWWFSFLSRLGIYVAPKSVKDAEIVFMTADGHADWDTIHLGTPSTESQKGFWSILNSFSPGDIIKSYITLVRALDELSKKHQEDLYGKYRVTNWRDAKDNMDRWGFAVYKPSGEDREFLYVKQIGRPVITRMKFG